jgi:hypothetical protein
MTDEDRERVRRLQSKPWNDLQMALPVAIQCVPGMLSHEEKRLLYYLAREDYTGSGVIADMGAFLGGSTICFAAALKERSFTQPRIHSYDLFRLGDSERERYFGNDAPPGLRTRHVFDLFLRDYLDLVVVHEGDALGFTWDGTPIEILFVDIAKSYRVFDHLLMHYFPAVLAGRGLIVMQDYLWPSTGPWHHVALEKLESYCEYVVDTGINSAVFRVTRPIPGEILAACRWMEMTQEEKLHYMDRAVAKMDTPEKRDALLGNRQLLVEGKDRYWGMHYHALDSEAT